jgi:hypothetical protein
MRNYPNYQINMARGDSCSFGLEFEGLGQDLDTAFLTVKKNALDEEPLFQKSLEHGISKQDTDKYVVRIAPTDTAELDAGEYPFDVQIGVNNDVFTIMLGIIILSQDVTN